MPANPSMLWLWFVHSSSPSFQKLNEEKWGYLKQKRKHLSDTSLSVIGLLIALFTKMKMLARTEEATPESVTNIKANQNSSRITGHWTTSFLLLKPTLNLVWKNIYYNNLIGVTLLKTYLSFVASKSCLLLLYCVKFLPFSVPRHLRIIQRMSWLRSP